MFRSDFDSEGSPETGSYRVQRAGSNIAENDPQCREDSGLGLIALQALCFDPCHRCIQGARSITMDAGADHLRLRIIPLYPKALPRDERHSNAKAGRRQTAVGWATAGKTTRELRSGFSRAPTGQRILPEEPDVVHWAWSGRA